ncbi:MAG: cysteine hydrolase, partial [Gemmatimonadota bacterium]|nr:cysteine hydrolase [Gemmatimonadota bacterium]
AGNLDFTAIIVSDATATFERDGHDGRHYSAEVMHDTALASLNGEFAAVATTSEVIAALPTREVGPMSEVDRHD